VADAAGRLRRYHVDMKRMPPLLVDFLIAIGFLWMGLSSGADSETLGNGPFTREPDWFNTLLIFIQTLPLTFRRRAPQAVLWVLIGAFAVDRVMDYPGTFATVGIVLAFHAVGSELPRRRSAVLGFSLVGFVVVFTTAGALTLESVGWEEIISTGLWMLIPLILGREVHQRRLRTQALEDRAERAEQEREELAAEAVAEERARIARELHDVVAHQMAVMTLQAEGARRLIGEGDARVADALDTIRMTGHDALDEMRSMVGLLRGSESIESVDLAPQPGLADLDRLIEQMRDSGLEIDFERRGIDRSIPGGLDLHAYRIVQESLTNTLKHGGPGVAVTVLIEDTGEALEIEVTDNGGGTMQSSNGGHGLVGMRERVSLLDGELTAGTVGDGFRVHATLPVGT
jgi:signal transduction histidine kinase